MTFWPPSPKLAAIYAVAFFLLLVLAPGRGPFSLRFLRLYPKKLGSSAVGWAANQTLPAFLRPPLLGHFAHSYGLNLNEAEHPLQDYESLQSLFTRRLKPGLRPQDPVIPGFINSPVDGRIIASGRIEKNMAIQAKGLPYRITELLKHDADATRFEGGHYVTLYLAPKDYHRIHVPLNGRVSAVGRVEGELWPVNDASTLNIGRLYERNRRATWVATGTDADEGLEVAAILVGATHVGGVLIDARWRQGRELPKDGTFAIADLPCESGQDLGCFAFGSTVVLLIAGPKADVWKLQKKDGDVKVGQRLGAFE